NPLTPASLPHWDDLPCSFRPVFILFAYLASFAGTSSRESACHTSATSTFASFAYFAVHSSSTYSEYSAVCISLIGCGSAALGILRLTSQSLFAYLAYFAVVTNSASATPV